MNMFKVEGQIYKLNGSLSNEYQTYYYSTADEAMVQYRDMKNKHYINEDGTVGMKMYSVHLYVQSYKEIDDVNAFFAQFQ